jgi:hypothetical protein
MEGTVMDDKRQKLAEYLQSDSTLMSMLGENRPWNNSKGNKSSQNSVIPSGKGPLSNMPYLSINYAADALQEQRLTNAFFTIRCYNSTDKTYVEIDRVLSRVKVLLHRHRFNFADEVSIDTVYETTGSELQDQGYGQNFRQSQYRLSYL